MRLDLGSGVEGEIEEAADWYLSRGAHLKSLFLAEVDKTIARIVSNPRLYPLVHADIRRAPVRRFPFGVFFFVEGDRIEVVAVVHDARHSAVWSHRR